MPLTTRRSALYWLVVTLAGALGGCLGRNSPSGGRNPTTSEPTATATTTGPPTKTPTQTTSPTETAIPESALDSTVEVRFGDSRWLPGNGVEVYVQEVRSPDTVKAYVRDDDGHVRWAEFPADDSRFGIYRNEHGTLVRSFSADAGIETGGDSVDVDELGWEPGASPERTVELFAVFDGEEHLLGRERGLV